MFLLNYSSVFLPRWPKSKGVALCPSFFLFMIWFLNFFLTLGSFFQEKSGFHLLLNFTVSFEISASFFWSGMYGLSSDFWWSCYFELVFFIDFKKWAFLLLTPWFLVCFRIMYSLFYIYLKLMWQQYHWLYIGIHGSSNVTLICILVFLCVYYMLMKMRCAIRWMNLPKPVL